MFDFYRLTNFTFVLHSTDRERKLRSPSVAIRNIPLPACEAGGSIDAVAPEMRYTVALS